MFIKFGNALRLTTPVLTLLLAGADNSAEVEQSSCTANKYFIKKQTSPDVPSKCGDCPLNEWSAAAAAQCTPCGAGEERDDASGATKHCKACGEGHFSGPSGCEECTAGRYSDTPTNTCKVCAKGKKGSAVGKESEAEACGETCAEKDVTTHAIVKFCEEGKELDAKLCWVRGGTLAQVGEGEEKHVECQVAQDADSTLTTDSTTEGSGCWPYVVGVSAGSGILGGAGGYFVGKKLAGNDGNEGDGDIAASAASAGFVAAIIFIAVMLLRRSQKHRAAHQVELCGSSLP